MSRWTVNGLETGATLIQNVKLSARSLDVGSCTFKIGGALMDTATLFSFEETVTVAQDGTVRWQGPVVSPKASGGGLSESHSFEVADAWYWLQHQTFMQPWNLRGGTHTAYSPRCILGRSADGATYGAPITAAAAIAEIVGYAASSGRPVAVGTISLPYFFKQEEVANVTCYEAILRILKWFPDAVGWWTYGAGIPQLNIGRRSDLSLATITATDTRIGGQGIDLTPRRDLRPGSVCLIYAINNIVDGQSVIDQQLDVSPGGANGRELRSLVVEIPINGYDRHFLKERIFSDHIELSVSGGDDLRRARIFWGAALGLTGKVKAVSGDAGVPELNFSTLPSGFFFDRSLPLNNQSDASYDPLNTATDAEKQRQWYETHPLVLYNSTNALNARKIVLDTALMYVLRNGSVKPWMNGIKAQAQLFTCKVSYTPIGGSRTAPQIMSAILTATNATTQTYTALDSVTNGEQVPTGLAAAMFSALNHDNYTGTVQFQQDECDFFFGLGIKLDIVGGQAGWATMAAPISQVDYNIDQGETVAHVGPPAHLAPRDFISLMAMQRNGLGRTGAGAANIREQQYGY